MSLYNPKVEYNLAMGIVPSAVMIRYAPTIVTAVTTPATIARVFLDLIMSWIETRRLLPLGNDAL